ncbi:glycosyltransferase (plasmid) [Roseivivax marinus]|uniref:glycosyltransferase family 2 protein n=1 Tax=Roseivivax marinus TaxID=1379903 RepID=UPI001F050314|nr:glycosyltransferase family 2 protein [Roseivivax marinus]UMA67207.1 glycosyltransferase [Roseivivax marinus]
MAEHRLFDAAWYKTRYPDVATTGLSPAEHFVRIGIRLGRDPGPNFSAKNYLSANPDVAAANINAFQHYLSSGEAEERALCPAPAERPALSRLTKLRSLLETGGLDRGPLKELEALSDETDSDAAAGACETLAFWNLAQNKPIEALAWFDRRLALGNNAAVRQRLAPVRMIAQVRAGKQSEALAIRGEHPTDPEVALAACHITTAEDARCLLINSALSTYDLAPITLAPGLEPAFDRLQATAPPMERWENSPVVSVIVAAHNAEATIYTALCSLTKQSWSALDIIVVDDASSDGTAEVVSELAAKDPRIRLLRLSSNRGAYGARNAGLAAARGTFLTLHDADDWAHPQRIAKQMEFLAARPEHLGCLSTQVRCAEDLRPVRWSGEGWLRLENLSSLMLPTALIRDCLGAWDEVTVSADSELLRRVRQLFGPGSVVTLDDGPLAFVREREDSATAGAASGMGWFYYGARREYYEAQLYHHRHAAVLRYTSGKRPFPIPGRLDPERRGNEEVFLDRVYAGLLVTRDLGLEALFAWLEEDRVANRQVGLVPLYDLSMDRGAHLFVHPDLRANIDGCKLRVLCFGEKVRCDLYRRLPHQHVCEAHRYLPLVRTGEKEVLGPGWQPEP